MASHQKAFMSAGNVHRAYTTPDKAVREAQRILAETEDAQDRASLDRYDNSGRETTPIGEHIGLDWCAWHASYLDCLAESLAAFVAQGE